MKTTRLVLWFLALFLLTGLATTQSTQSEPVALVSGSAVIADLKGEVMLQSPQGVAVTAQKGQVLPAESSIETAKGSLLLSLQDGSQVLVKPHSRVVLKAPEQSHGDFLQLFLGNILAKVQKRLGNDPSFRMGTPTAVITVRGTRFSVEVTKKNKTIVQVYEGLVEVVGVGMPNQPILIKPGFYTQVDNDRPPQSPREIQGVEGPGGRGAEGESESPFQRNQGTGDAGERNVPQGTNPGQGQHEDSAPAKPEGPD
ncbi:MAG: FecR family protein [Candidatus Korobacteraceae bacterium]